MKKERLVLWVGATLTSVWLANPAASQSIQGNTDDTSSASEIVVTGTRQSGVTAANSAAPIELVGKGALSHVGEPDLIQGLAQNLPSFNEQPFAFDTAQLAVSAALRGLSPNDTLVLVNGQRRHTTANLAVDGGTAYTGSAAADLGLIPVASIDHVEVLQDGASAQYGSDAIAGVINIILKDASSGGSASVTGGSYYQGGGATGALYVNGGFPLADKGAINLTAEERYHDFSRQGGCDSRFFTSGCALLPGLDPTVAAGLVSSSGFPFVSRIIGDAQSSLINLVQNSNYKVSNELELFSDATYSHRDAASYQNYHSATFVTPNVGEATPFPQGFSPEEVLTENDFSISLGAKGIVDGFNWKASTVYGRDNDEIHTDHSANASLYAANSSLQTSFRDGSFTSSEWTNNIDLSRPFAVGMASPLNVAFGAEARVNTYSIAAGEPASYYGSGAAAFPGFVPSDAGIHRRTDYAGYVDLAGDPIEHLLVDLAGRYENFSDFGSAATGKLTARYDFSDYFSVRGTVSSGVRAPSLAEEYYSATSISLSSAYIQLPPNSPAAALAGFSPLRPEESENYSVGIILRPSESVHINVDAYNIDIQHRIVDTGFLLGAVGNYVISQGVENAIALHGNGGTQLPLNIAYTGINVFTNGANTRTSGVEVTATYKQAIAQFGSIDWSAGFNFNDTSVVKQANLPAASTNVSIGQDKILNAAALTALTDSAPREKLILAALYSVQKWTINLRETVYGETSELTSADGSGEAASGQVYKLKVPIAGITDLDIGYRLTSSLRIQAGANNLLNKRPPDLPSGLIGTGAGTYDYNEPLLFSPYGINGGYYYAKVTVNF